MLVLLSALLLQVQVETGKVVTPKGDTVRGIAVRARQQGDEERARRIPVTERHLATAFGSPAARTLLLSAREARMRQDSAIVAYDARVYERVSAGLGFAKVGRQRLVFRHEDAARVRWSRDQGAWIDVTGARTLSPDEDEVDEDLGDMVLSPVPYRPGGEELLFMNGGGRLRREVNEKELVHPLAEGAEAYYAYSAGDSSAFQLPDGTRVRLAELRVRPRQPKWNVVVGSLWFDVRSGQLVRAAYRLAVPMDIWEVAKEDDPHAKDDVPKWLDPLLTPMTARVTAIGIEYGLYEGRFWLPRARLAEGDAQVSFARFPFKFEQRFTYTAVNAARAAMDSLPRIVADAEDDSLSEEARDRMRDSARAARRAGRDSVRQGLKKRVEQCDTARVRTITQRREGLRTLVRIPCDEATLAASPDLPKSIYDEGEEAAYTQKELRELLEESIGGLGAQPGFHPLPPDVHYGVDLLRYNRVEGLSAGVSVTQQLGAGYSALAVARIGTADREPNVELTGMRSNLTRTLRLTAYNRLVAANDWGNPLGFGGSFGALFFGRDEGFYYRATGAELSGTHERSLIAGQRMDWRLFAERERTARRRTTFSVGGTLPPNIEATRGGFAGGALRLLGSYGENPNRTRLFTDLRMEGAGGDTVSFGRAALDLTLTQGLGRVGAALTVAGGSTVGDVPAQRLWYLGGTHTVRGQRAGAAVGDAFWLARGELGTTVRVVRPVLFGDVGWAGARDALSAVGRPLSGVGIGASVMDGLVRLDLARGIHPEQRWGLNLYVEGKF